VVTPFICSVEFRLDLPSGGALAGPSSRGDGLPGSGRGNALPDVRDPVLTFSEAARPAGRYGGVRQMQWEG
jgi:hypothetical protein